MTKKIDQFLRHWMIWERMFSWFNISPSSLHNRYSSCGWAGRISSLWFCFGLWSARKSTCIQRSCCEQTTGLSFLSWFDFFIQIDALTVARGTYLRRSLWAKQRVSPFYRDLILHPNRCSNSCERNVFEALVVSKQRVSPFCNLSHLADSQEFDFRIWFSPGFPMQ